jgi:hypothetical protein
MLLAALVAMLAVATLPAIAQNVAQIGALPETPEIPQPPQGACDAPGGSEVADEAATVQYRAEGCVVEFPPGTELGTEKL